MEEIIVSAAQALESGISNQKVPLPFTDAVEFTEGGYIIGDPAVIEKIAGNDEVELFVRKRKIEHGSLHKLCGAPPHQTITKGFGRKVYTPYLAEVFEELKHPPCSAPHI